MKHMEELSRLNNIKAPDKVKARTLIAAREIRSGQIKQSIPQHLTVSPRRSIGKKIMAAVCAFGILTGGFTYWKSRDTDENGESAPDTIISAVANSFGFVAYAADTKESYPPHDSRIVFSDGSGTADLEKGFFSGCLFRVTGDNIQSISASIDKGGLYRSKTVSSEGADRDKWALAMYQGENPELLGADQVSVHGYGGGEEDKIDIMYADLSWLLENGFTETYDPEVSYGFWAPKASMDDPEMDLRDEWHALLDQFEGATLTVTVSFTDGSRQTQILKLHTGKLGVKYTDDTSGPQYTGEVLTDEQAAEQGYLYGVYADITET